MNGFFSWFWGVGVGLNFIMLLSVITFFLIFFFKSQDGKLTQVTRPSPPNFGPGFVSKFSRIPAASLFWVL